MRSLLSIVCASFFLIACQSGAAVGTSCARDGDCASPLACRSGRCRAQCVENRDCPVGSRCLLFAGAGSCSIESDDRCQSGGDRCPAGLVCLADHCVNTCHVGTDCPADAMCIDPTMTGVGFCYSPDRPLSDAGPLPDVGPLDGDVPDAGPPSDMGPPSDAGTDCRTSSCAVDLCVGGAHACAVRGDHHVVCWGDDAHGQLGDGVDSMSPTAHSVSCIGTTNCSGTPVTVRRAVDGMPLLATHVACSEATTCAVTTDGDVVCWGYNGDWETGTMADTDVAQALALSLGTDVTDIHAMRSVFCADRVSGVRTCWGYDNDDVLGVGHPDAAVLPTAATAWTGRALAVGLGHICGLGATDVTCAGNYLEGELGIDPSGGGASSAMVTVTLPSLPTELAAGEHATCALVAGQALCWGGNDLGQLGRAAAQTCPMSAGSTTACDWTPTAVPTIGGLSHVWAEGNTGMFCAGDATHTWCWGATDASGCLLAGGTCNAPTRVNALTGARTVAPGATSVCAIDANGRVLCFGANQAGQVGLTPSSTTVLSDGANEVCISCI